MRNQNFYLTALILSFFFMASLPSYADRCNDAQNWVRSYWPNPQQGTTITSKEISF